MDDKIQLKEIIKGLDIELNKNRNYNFFDLLLRKIFNRENSIPLFTLKTENGKGNFIINIGNKIFYIDFYFNGVIFYDSFFTHSPYIINRKYRQDILDNQIKNYLFNMYENKITNEILLKNQYFDDNKTKEINKLLFFNYLNHILKYRFISFNKFNLIANKINIERLDENTKLYDNYFMIGDVLLPVLYYQIIKSYNDDIFDYHFERYKDSNAVINYFILQNLIDFNLFIDTVIKNTKETEHKNKLIEVNNNLIQYNKHCILSYLTFEDIKRLVLD